MENSKEKQIEEMAFTEVDILANDINQHCADLAETYCGGINCLTCLAHALTEKGYRKASEVFEEIEKVAMSKIDADLSIAVLNDTYYIEAIDELKKKYTEGNDEKR